MEIFDERWQIFQVRISTNDIYVYILIEVITTEKYVKFELTQPIKEKKKEKNDTITVTVSF